MSGRTFLSSKHKSSSATFSLHFNKADEEQLEFNFCAKERKLNGLSLSETDFGNPTPAERDEESQNLRSSLGSLSDFSLMQDFNQDQDAAKSALLSGVPRVEIKKEVVAPLHAKLTHEHSEVSDGQTHVKHSLSYSDFFGNHSSPSESQQTLLNPSESCDTALEEKSHEKALKRAMHESFKAEIQSRKNESETLFKTVHSKEDSRNKTFHGSTDKLLKFVDFARNNGAFHLFLSVLVCIQGPFPTWISGFLVGIIVSGSLFYWLFKPIKRSKKPENCFIKSSDICTSHQDNIQQFQGWMNALPENLEYYPESYHSALTRSVFVRLDGSSLRLSFPGKNIPKRAMFNEPRFDLQFVCQKHYSMMDACVELAPKSLSKGRLWNKRYPICLRIPCVKKPLSSSTCDLGTNDFDGTTIYLFSRTDRDKHMWFLRFLNSLNLKRKKSPSSLSLNSLSSSLPSDKERNSVDFTSLQFKASEVDEKREPSREDFVEICMNKQEKFEFYLSNLLNPLNGKKHASGKSADVPASGDLMWLNVFLGRLSFDFFMEEKWTLLVAERIQRKLNRLQLPFFLSELKVKEVHLGSTLPHLCKVSDPVVDEKGVWIYIDMSYDGPFLMTLETKLNLSKFQESSEEIWTPLTDFSGLSKDDMEAKSSACSSDDESVDSLSESDCDSNVSAALPERTSKSSRLMKFVDRLAQSSYVKSATKNKYVKRAMDDLSKKPLLLTVQVQWLTGTLALNIPPWPTDRLWYGFQKNTSLSITARPKLGQHVVRLSHVLEWIEKKLVSEFQKALVLPNMDDLIIPVMKSDLELD